MAAPSGDVWQTPRVYKHHEQQTVCHTRAKYREGRRPKAVKVYTINLESRFLLVQGVPAIGVMTELVQLFAIYGVIEEYRILDEYPAEQFTEVYLLKFQKLTSARAAKRNTDEKSFYGGILHVCYAPEYETVDDTRKKLQDRRRYVIRACQKPAQEQKLESNETSNSAAVLLADSKEERQANRNQGESSNPSIYSEFPLLPLPPSEEVPLHCLSSGELKAVQESLPREDKMGTLHNFIPGSSEHNKQTSDRPNQISAANKARENIAKNKSTVPRFIPRTAHLETRKRKMENSKDLLGMMDKNAPLFGPKLPEPLRTDMGDDSLNLTANLIRKTMTQVASVSSDKKTTTTPKQRRRI